MWYIIDAHKKHIFVMEPNDVRKLTGYDQLTDEQASEALGMVFESITDNTDLTDALTSIVECNYV